MQLVHKLANGQNVIPLDPEAALDAKSFRTISTRDGVTGEVTHVALGITLRSMQRFEGDQEEGARKKRAKYEGHAFELQVTPAYIDRWIEALQVAKQRFEKAEVPG